MNHITRIYSIIPKNKIKYFYYLIFLVFISVLLETVGIGLIYPLIKIINTEQVNINSYLPIVFNPLSRFYQNLSLNKKEIIVIYILIITFLFILKFLIQLLSSFLFSKFLSLAVSDISNKFYNYYLERPFSHSSKNDSSKEMNIIINKIAIVSNDCFYALINIIPEIFILFTLLILLFLINYKIIFFVIILLIVVFFIFIILKKYLIKIGELRIRHFSKVIQLLQEGFSGLLEIKLFGIENKFLKKFNFHNTRRIYAERKFNFINTSQRIVIEFLFAVGFLIYLFFYVINNQDIEQLVPIFALYTIVMVRVLPSVHRIIYNFNRIINAESSSKFVYSQLKFINNVYKNISKKNNINFNELLVKDLFFRYSKDKKYLFNKINFKISKGDIVGIVGDSGRGKTTFLKIILGLLIPEKGGVFLNKKNINLNLKNWHSIASYAAQTPYFINDTIQKNIILGSKKSFNKNNYLNAIKFAAINDFINQLSNKGDTIVGERGLRLSQGQKQRICLARIFYLKPKFIILDESTSALDNNTEKVILQNLYNLNKKERTTIIIVSHRESALKICKKIININKFK
jgi:ABC-type multidrug transport system fused ATPase/permease subunit